MQIEELTSKNPLKDWREQINDVVQHILNETQDANTDEESDEDYKYVWGDDAFRLLNFGVSSDSSTSGIDMTKIETAVKDVLAKDPATVAAVTSNKLVRSGAIYYKMIIIVQIALYLLSEATKRISVVYPDYNVAGKVFDWTSKEDQKELATYRETVNPPKVFIYKWNGDDNNTYLDSYVGTVGGSTENSSWSYFEKVKNDISTYGSVYYALFNSSDTSSQIRLTVDKQDRLCYVLESGEKYIIDSDGISMLTINNRQLNSDGKKHSTTPISNNEIMIAEDSITSTQIQDSAITGDKIASGCITEDKLDAESLLNYLTKNLLVQNYYFREKFPTTSDYTDNSSTTHKNAIINFYSTTITVQGGNITGADGTLILVPDLFFVTASEEDGKAQYINIFDKDDSSSETEKEDGSEDKDNPDESGGGGDKDTSTDTTTKDDTGTSQYAGKDVYIYGTGTYPLSGFSATDTDAGKLKFELSTEELITGAFLNGIATLQGRVLIGGFHVNENSEIVEDSIWDINYNNPSRPDTFTGVPTGTIITFAGTSTPTGRYLLCNGSLINRDDYYRLYVCIGDTYKNDTDTIDDTTTQFRLPSMSTSGNIKYYIKY